MLFFLVICFSGSPTSTKKVRKVVDRNDYLAQNKLNAVFQQCWLLRQLCNYGQYSIHILPHGADCTCSQGVMNML